MSELHDRLAHLVNYSSQLIFVSGDTVADQQRTLSDFLAAQEENTEISFITASSSKQAIDYRSGICRQLGGHTVGSFVRPLNQLLRDLSPEGGPYLVCITSADQLEASFLQELWDWVMHSQQHSQKIHLNVILFGRADWAESSQDWLPSQNSHKPVLLSSQSVNSSGFDVNALEALMANDRSWFSRPDGPLVSNKWFISGVLSTFLFIFIGLISWQYPEQIRQFVTLGEIQEREIEVFNLQGAERKSPIVDQDVLLAGSPKSQQQLTQSAENIAELSASSPKLEVVDKNASVTDSLLVSSWQEGTNSEFYNTKPALDTEAALAKQDLSGLPSAATGTMPLSKTQISPPGQEALANAVSASENDFQVPDIISIEQLDAQLGTKAADTLLAQAIVRYSDQATDLNQSTANFESKNDSSAPDSTPSSTLNLNQTQSAIDYRFDETTLLDLPTDAILLQLSGIQNPVVLENYLANNNLKASTWVYETQRYGGPWYVVLYRQSFQSIDAALSRLSSLPQDVQNAEPFAKSVNQIQQEIRRR